MSDNGRGRPLQRVPAQGQALPGSNRHLAVPMTRDAWMTEAKKHQVGMASLHENRIYHSASKMQDEQYLLLRALWSSREARELNISHEVGSYYEQQADQMLKSSNDWSAYIADIDRGSKLRYPHPQAGIFTSALLNMRDIIADTNTNEGSSESKVTAQHGILRGITNQAEQWIAAEDGLTPRKRRPPPRPDAATQQQVVDAIGFDTPPSLMTSAFARMNLNASADPDYTEGPTVEDEAAADDEMIVNMSLVLWVQAVSSLCRDNTVHCSIARATFTLGNKWKALTDGKLFDTANRAKIYSIIEAKRYKRLGNHVNVRRQEAGEMACWIFSDQQDLGCYVNEERLFQGPGAATPIAIRSYKRLLIAQDQQSIWFVVATYDNYYASYIRDKNTKPDDDTFMYMREYGPFDIWVPDHMEKAAKFLLAFYLRINQRRMRVEQGLHQRDKSDPRNQRSESARRRLPSQSRSRQQSRQPTPVSQQRVLLQPGVPNVPPTGPVSRPTTPKPPG